MEILKSKKDWLAYTTKQKARFNMPEANSIGEPAHYPCIVISYPVINCNQESICNRFVYKKEAKALLNI